MTSLTKKLAAALLAVSAALCLTFGLLFTVPKVSFAAESETIQRLDDSDLTDGLSYFEIEGGVFTGLSDKGVSKAGNDKFSVVLPSTVKKISASTGGKGLLESLSTKLVSLTIPSSVEEIGDNAFYGCSNIVTLDLTNATSLTKIGANAFNSGVEGSNNSSKLSTVTIPAGVTTIGNAAFANHNSLSVINFYATACGDFGSGANNPFHAAGYATPGVTVNIGYKAAVAEDSVTVTKIPANMFYDSTAYNCKLSTVNFNSVNVAEGDFGANAFRSRSNLGTVTFDASDCAIEEIGSYAFASSGITSVSLSSISSLKKISGYAFNGCDSLTSVTLPSSVEEIGDYSFALCAKLNSFAFNNNIQTIGASAFSGCSSLTTVTIPSSVTSIGNNAFNGCSAVTTINYYAANASLRTSASPFTGVGGAVVNIDGSNAKVMSLPGYLFYKTAITAVNFVNASINLTNFGNSVFESCTALARVSFDDGCAVKKIGNRAFYGCTALSSIDLSHDSLTVIDFYAFGGCTALTEVRLPAELTTIGESAFDGCSQLWDITLPESVSLIEKNAFNNCVSIYTINVPSGIPQEDSFTTSSGVSTLEAGIGDNAFAGCTRLIEVCNLSSRVINAGDTANGGVALYAKFVSQNKDVTKIDFADNIVEGQAPEAGAFVFFEGEGTDVYLVSYRGTHAVLTLPAYNGSYSYKILARAFERNTGITDVVIPDGIIEMGEYAFSGCSNLTTIKLPSNLSTIGAHTFEHCISLKSIKIPELTSTIGAYAFSGCSSLNKIDFGNPQSSMGLRLEQNSFENCTALRVITIPTAEKGNGIGAYAFSGCSSLVNVYLPKSLTSYYSNAYAGCSANLVLIAPDAESYLTYSGASGFSGMLGRLTFAVDVALEYSDIGDTTQKTEETVEKLYNLGYNYKQTDGIWAPDGGMPVQNGYRVSVWYDENDNEVNADTLTAMLKNTGLTTGSYSITLHATTVAKPEVSLKATTLTYKDGSNDKTFAYDEIFTEAVNWNDDFLALYDVKITDFVYINNVRPSSVPSAIEEAGTYTVSFTLKDKETYGEWSAPLNVTVKIQPFTLRTVEYLEWVTASGELLSTGEHNEGNPLYVYYAGDNNSEIPYLKEQEQYKDSASDDPTRYVTNSYVIRNGSVTTLSLKNTNSPYFSIISYINEGNNSTCTASAAGVYTAAAKISVNNNYQFLTGGDGSELEARGLCVEPNTDGTYTVMKTWYIVYEDGVLLLDKDGGTYAVNDWTYNSEAGIPSAPVFSGDTHNEEDNIRFTLSRYPDGSLNYVLNSGEDFDFVLEKTYADFGNVFNKAMPSGSYLLEIYVTAGGDEQKITYKFTVQEANPVSLLEKGGSLAGTLEMYSVVTHNKLYNESSPAVQFADAESMVPILGYSETKLHSNKDNSRWEWYDDAKYGKYYTKFNIQYSVLNQTTGAGATDSAYYSFGDYFTSNPPSVVPKEPGVYKIYFTLSAPGYMTYGANRSASYKFVIYRSISLPNVSAVTYNGDGNGVHPIVPDSVYYKAIYLNNTNPVGDEYFVQGLNTFGYDKYTEVGPHKIALMIYEEYSEYVHWAVTNVGNSTRQVAALSFTIAPANNSTKSALYILNWEYGKYDEERNVPVWATEYYSEDAPYEYMLVSKSDPTKYYVYGSETNGFDKAEAGEYRFIATAPKTANWNAWSEEVTINVIHARITWDTVPYVQSWRYGDYKTMYKIPAPVLDSSFSDISDAITTYFGIVGKNDRYSSLKDLEDATGEIPAGNYVLVYELDTTVYTNFEPFSYPVYFSVLQAENYWDTTPTVYDWIYGEFASRISAPTAVPHFTTSTNTVEFTYYELREDGTASSQGYADLKDMVDGNGELPVGRYMLVATYGSAANFAAMPETRVTFNVSKAQNSWVEIPVIVGWSEGRFKSGSNAPSATSQFGTVIFTVIDSKGNELVSGNADDINYGKLKSLGVGSYTLKAYVAGNANYDEMTAYATFAVFEDSVGITGLIAATMVFAVIAVGLAVGGVVLLILRNKKIEAEFRKMVKSELKRR